MVPSEGVGSLCGVQVLVSGSGQGGVVSGSGQGGVVGYYLSCIIIGFCFGGNHTPSPC